MSSAIHRSIIGLYVLIILGTFILLAFYGASFYKLPVEDRFFHQQYELLKPSGFIGHALGICGSLLIVSGMVLYTLRKRVKAFSRWGRLKNWLEFHIFLCTWGTVMVLFHTTFKFGGVIAIGFWSLVIVWVSGLIGRFLYIQIPKTIEGREFTLYELIDSRQKATQFLQETYKINFPEIKKSSFSQIKFRLIENKIPKNEFGHIKKLIRKQKILEYRINRLDRMRKLFHYWHIAHIPFAAIMVLILIIHVSVVLFFGYKWIF